MRNLTLLLLFVALATAGCGGKTELKRIVLTDQVDARQAPVRAVESFPEGARALYLSVLVANPVKEKTQIKVRWRLGDQLIDEFHLTMPDTKDRWVTFDLKAAKPFPHGQYKAEVFLNDTLMHSLPFRVGS